jgi:hypothetical protein
VAICEVSAPLEPLTDRADGPAIALDGYPPVRRSSMLLATSSHTAAKSNNSCLPKTFSVFPQVADTSMPLAEGNHPNPCLPLRAEDLS